MLMTKMREHMKIILWILVLAFVGTIIFSWGMDITGRGGRSGAQRGIIGKINGIEVTRDYYFNLLQDQYMRYRQQTGQDPDRRVMQMMRDQIWENIVNSTLITQEIQRKGIKVSDEEVVFQLRNNPPVIVQNNPAFLTDNEFDIQKYYNLMTVQDPQVTAFWAQLEDYVRSSLPSNKIQNLVASTIRVTENEIYEKFLQEEQTARVKYMYCGSEEFIDTPVQITDSEIQDYYSSHIEDYKVSPQRKLKYVFFELKATKDDSVMVTEEIKNVIERAKAGEDFAELARTYSKGPSAENGGDLGYFVKGAMVEEFDNAVFKADVGDIVGPVKTSFGIHIIKVEDRKPAKPTTSKRKKIADTDSIRARHILFKYEPSDNTVDNVRYNANIFAELAKEQGFDVAAQEESLEIQETDYFRRSGFIPGIGLLDEALTFAFNSELNDISDAIKVTNGFYVFQLAGIQPERTKTLEEVRPTIEDILAQQKRKNMAGELIAKVREKITGDMSFEEAAQTDSLEVEETDEFRLDDYIDGIGRELKFSAAAFKLQPGEISEPIEGTRGYYLLQLIEKTDADTSLYKTRKEEIEQELLQEKQEMLFSEWLAYLRDKANIKDYRKEFFGE